MQERKKERKNPGNCGWLEKRGYLGRIRREGEAASRKDQGGGTRHELRANCPGDCSCSLLRAAVAAVCPARCFLDLEANLCPSFKILILSGNRVDLARLDPRSRDPYCFVVENF